MRLICITASPRCSQWSRDGSSSDWSCRSLQTSTWPRLRRAAPSLAGGRSPRSRATHAWSVGNTLGPVCPPGGGGQPSRVSGSGENAFGSKAQNRNSRNDKPPSSQLLTSQTGSGPAGKATPLYAARAPPHRSRPDAAAPAPCRPEDTGQVPHVAAF